MSSQAGANYNPLAENHNQSKALSFAQPDLTLGDVQGERFVMTGYRMKRAEDLFLGWVENGWFSIDEDGAIWRHHSHRGKGKRLDPPRRAEMLDSTGYLSIATHVKGEPFTAYAHRIVYRYFYGEIPPGMEIHHTDHSKDNNHPANLRAVTHRENINLSFKNPNRVMPKVYYGEEHHMAKMTEKKAHAARILYEFGGFTQQEIADILSISRSTIGLIIRRKSWIEKKG